MKKIYNLDKVSQALKKINKDLKSKITLKDIIDIDKNISIFEEEEKHIGIKEISTFFFKYKEGYLGYYSKKNIADRIRKVFKDKHISGDVPLDSIKFNSEDKEKKRALKIIGVKELSLVHPKAMDIKCYKEILKSLCE